MNAGRSTCRTTKPWGLLTLPPPYTHAGLTPLQTRKSLKATTQWKSFLWNEMSPSQASPYGEWEQQAGLSMHSTAALAACIRSRNHNARNVFYGTTQVAVNERYGATFPVTRCAPSGDRRRGCVFEWWWRAIRGGRGWWNGTARWISCLKRSWKQTKRLREQATGGLCMKYVRMKHECTAVKCQGGWLISGWRGRMTLLGGGIDPEWSGHTTKQTNSRLQTIIHLPLLSVASHRQPVVCMRGVCFAAACSYCRTKRTWLSLS